MRTSDIQTAEPFKSLFPISRAVQIRIELDMEKNGFDPAMPIILWQEGKCVIDGHTRLGAAINENIADVPVIEKSFDTEDAAVLYAIHCQKNRRNASEPDLLRWIKEADKRKTKAEVSAMANAIRHSHPPDGGWDNITTSPRNGKPSESEYSAAETAAITGTSPRKVERARAVMAHPDLEEKVMQGEMTINGASIVAAERNKAARKSKPVPIAISPSVEKRVKDSIEKDRTDYLLALTTLRDVVWDLPNTKPVISGVAGASIKDKLRKIEILAGQLRKLINR